MLCASLLSLAALDASEAALDASLAAADAVEPA